MPELIKNPVQMLCGDSDLIDRLVTFLTYSGIDAQKAYDDEDDSYALLVDADDRRRASHLAQSYLMEEKERQASEEKKAAENESAPYSHIYEKCEDRYKNHLSTAVSFAVIGTGLLVLLLLSSLNVIRFPISYHTNRFTFFTLTAAGIFFEVIAVVSFRRALQLKQQIADEEALTSSIINWFITTYDKKQLDDCIMAMEDEIESEEVLDLKRYEIISCYLTRENEHLDESYVTKLTEDIYTLIYEN
ncbi:MAG: hypothetical protein IJZ85_08615 [Lachnospiraceae bacterium]|nr:hypothetical protein [Lachnospiraceae bacterium]